VTQGVRNIRDSAALAGPAGGTTVNLGAQLQLEGNLTIQAEPLTASGMGPGTGTYGVGMANTDGAIFAVSGNSLWAGPVNPGTTLNLGGVTTIDATALFPNGGFTTFTGSGVNVATGATLHFGIAVAGGAGGVKLGG